MSKTKITAKIYKHLLKDFSLQIDALFLKRDAFLNSMIQGEIQHLAQDMEGKRSSTKANRYISGQLKNMGATQVNIVVDQSTADALNSIVANSNMVRDAFINRLLLLLRASPILLQYLELPEFVNGSSFDSCIEPMPTSPLRAMKDIQSDPLYYLRVGAEERLGMGLYLIPMPPKFIGFSCYLDDSDVPGTEEYQKAQDESEKSLNDMMLALEADAFQQPILSKGVKS